MADKKTISEYLPTVGIECHVQLKTKTKLFAAVGNDARGAEPNTLVSPVCFGLPGVLPVLNEVAVKLAIRAGHALNAKVNIRSVFDRKLYFYPDLPKGYQISQFHEPIVGEGYVEVPTDEGYVKVGITRAHLEEDAGKLTHIEGADYSLVDLNRAGTPLIEIVSEPDIHSASVGKTYAQELYYLMKYADVSDVDLYHGNMRFDVNISVAKKDAKELGIRAEIKNLNSYKSIEKSIEYEINRQVDLLEKGEKVIQETRGWDDVAQKTYSQRSKEDSNDYRYFPDPDVPPVILTQAEIDAQKEKLPIMPKQRREMLEGLGLDKSQIEVFIDRKVLGDLMLAVVRDAKSHAKRVANWLSGDVVGYLTKNDVEEVLLDKERLVELSEMVEAGDLNSNAASKVVVEMITDKSGAKQIADKHNLSQVSDEGELNTIIEKVIAENQKAASDIKAGEMKAVGFLVGQVMKESKGKANPGLAKEIILKQIKE